MVFPFLSFPSSPLFFPVLLLSASMSGRMEAQRKWQEILGGPHIREGFLPSLFPLFLPFQKSGRNTGKRRRGVLGSYSFSPSSSDGRPFFSFLFSPSFPPGERIMERKDETDHVVEGFFPPPFLRLTQRVRRNCNESIDFPSSFVVFSLYH